MTCIRGGRWRRQDFFESRFCWVKGRLFLAFFARRRHCVVVWLTSFSVKEGVKPERWGFQPMRKKLGERFGVVFSFAVVVMDTELSTWGFFLADSLCCLPMHWICCSRRLWSYLRSVF